MKYPIWLRNWKEMPPKEGSHLLKFLKKSISFKAGWEIWRGRWKLPFQNCPCAKPILSNIKTKERSYRKVMRMLRNEWNRVYHQLPKQRLNTWRWLEIRSDTMNSVELECRRKCFSKVIHHLQLKQLQINELIHTFPMKSVSQNPMVPMPLSCISHQEQVCATLRSQRLNRYKFDYGCINSI